MDGVTLVVCVVAAFWIGYCRGRNAALLPHYDYMRESQRRAAVMGFNYDRMTPADQRFFDGTVTYFPGGYSTSGYTLPNGNVVPPQTWRSR